MLDRNTLTVIHFSSFPIIDLRFYGQQITNMQFFITSIRDDIKNIFIMREIDHPYGIKKDDWIDIQFELARILNIDLLIRNYRKELDNMKDLLANNIIHIPYFLDTRYLLKAEKYGAKGWVELNIMPGQSIKNNDKRRKELNKIIVDPNVFVMSVSKEVKKAVIKSGYLTKEALAKKEYIKVIENGINRTLYNVVENEEIARHYKEYLGIEKDKKVVVFIGRPELYKGWYVIEKILEKYDKQKRDDVVFLFAFSPTYASVKAKEMADKNGKGTYLDNAKETFSKLSYLPKKDLVRVYIDLSKFFYFDPALIDSFEKIFGKKKEQIADLKEHIGYVLKDGDFPLKQYFYGPIFFPITTIADIMILPTFSEAYGLVVAESIEAGAFVISSNIGGVPALVSKQNSLLVDHPLLKKIEKESPGKKIINRYVNEVLFDLYDRALEKALDKVERGELDRKKIKLSSRRKIKDYERIYPKIVKELKELKRKTTYKEKLVKLKNIRELRKQIKIENKQQPFRNRKILINYRRR